MRTPLLGVGAADNGAYVAQSDRLTAGPRGGPLLIAHDRFAGTNGEALDTSDSGHAWTHHTGSHTYLDGYAAATSAPARSTVDLGQARYQEVEAYCGMASNIAAAEVGLVFGYVDEDNYWRLVYSHSTSNKLEVVGRASGVDTVASSVTVPRIDRHHIRHLRVVSLNDDASTSRHVVLGIIDDNPVIDVNVSDATLNGVIGTRAGITSSNAAHVHTSFVARGRRK